MDPLGDHSRRGNSPVHTRQGADEQNALALNVLLLGDRRSGRSSVGNALIGAHEFRTGTCTPGVSVAMECQVLSRNFPRYFRRRGSECDLVLRVIDSCPPLPRPQSVHELCGEGEGVHVLVLVARADLPRGHTHLEQHLERLFGPEWRRHAALVLTHADHLEEEAGPHPSGRPTQTPDWLAPLADGVAGGVSLLDDGCDWPSLRGRPLRERLLRLSASNHHRALAVRTDA